MCVRCRKEPQAPGLRPFCSDRCRLLDLGAWLTESYRVEGDSVSDDAQPPENRESPQG